jgi:hypothetical protein
MRENTHNKKLLDLLRVDFSKVEIFVDGCGYIGKD